MKESDKLLKTILSQPMSKELLAMILKWALEVDNQWISTSERLPKHENTVIAVHNGQTIAMHYSLKFHTWVVIYEGLDGYGEFVNWNPTHWMEIPKPPKQ